MQKVIKRKITENCNSSMDRVLQGWRVQIPLTIRAHGMPNTNKAGGLSGKRGSNSQPWLKGLAKSGSIRAWLALCVGGRAQKLVLDKWCTIWYTTYSEVLLKV